MTTRGLSVPLLAVAFALLLATACGGDGDGDGARPVGRLTDPRSVPTPTPRGQPPAPNNQEPDPMTPPSGTRDEETEGNGEGGEEVTSVTPFQITVDDSANLRASPTTESGIVATMGAGDEATVTGQVRGELVGEGNDLWYQLEDGSFVYSGTVTKAEE
ncbi:MAG: SH3 domain-containing protein [Dehalococcoidia bacterium]